LAGEEVTINDLFERLVGVPPKQGEFIRARHLQIDQILKDIYLPAIRKQVLNGSPALLKLLERNG
jgi:hypothetical protein